MNFVYNHYIYIVYRQLLKSTKFQLRNVKNDKKNTRKAFSNFKKEKALRVQSA